MSRPIKVVIDLVALRHNFNYIRKLTHPARIMAIIKADAYGHGLISIAQALDQADAFGVACLEEGRQLRQAGIKQRINLLEGPYTAIELQEINDLAIDIVVHDISQIEMLEQTHLRHPINIWLKLDTGMHRLGFMPHSASSALSRLQQLSCVREILLMTHLACANERGNPLTLQQIEQFNKITKSMNKQRTLANSATIIAYPEVHLDWVRPGIMLYGVSPFSNSDGLKEGLQPVMTLCSALIAVKRLKTGDTVGYGATWRCPQDMTVGMVAAGYGDGYPRHAKFGRSVLVNGKRAQVIGNVSMDILTVDLHQQPHAKIGDPVILWGKGLAVEEVAHFSDTIPHHILSTVQKHLTFCYDKD